MTGLMLLMLGIILGTHPVPKFEDLITTGSLCTTLNARTIVGKASAKKLFKAILNGEIKDNTTDLVNSLGGLDFTHFWIFCMKQSVIDRIMTNTSEFKKFMINLGIYKEDLITRFKDGLGSNPDTVANGNSPTIDAAAAPTADPHTDLLMKFIRMRGVLEHFNTPPSGLIKTLSKLKSLSIRQTPELIAVLKMHMYLLDSVESLNFVEPTSELIGCFIELRKTVTRLELTDVKGCDFIDLQLFQKIFEFKKVKEMSIICEKNADISSFGNPERSSILVTDGFNQYIVIMDNDDNQVIRLTGNLDQYRQIAEPADNLVTITDMPKLKKLVFCNLPKVQLLLTDLPHLKSLFIDNSVLREVALHKTDAVSHVDIRDTTIVNFHALLRALSDLKYLKTLSINGCKEILGIPEDVMLMKALTDFEIDLSHCSKLVIQKAGREKVVEDVEESIFELPKRLRRFTGRGDCFNRDLPYYLFRDCVFRNLKSVTTPNKVYDEYDVRKIVWSAVGMNSSSTKSSYNPDN